MDLKQIQYFIKISECSSISKASSELFVSQQALSKTVQKMEQELGRKLFHRTSRGIQLTQDGQYLLDKFQDLCTQFKKASAETYEYFDILSGELNFCSAPGFFRSISAELLIQFEEQYPNISLERMEMPDSQCEDYVREDKKHFGCTIRPRNLHGMEFVPLHQEPLMLIVNKENPLSDKNVVSMEDLSGEKFLFLDKRFSLHHQTLQACRNHGFEPKIVFQSADVSQLARLSSLNQGVFICVRHVYEEADNKNLVCVPIQDADMVWEVGLIYQDYEKLDPKGKLFIRYLGNELNHI